ncbi:nucleotidyl transferase AbiEii/AbiGii toxin family protein [Streptomyces sp. NPDC048241]|uniref:nucleotidyl transferase AbiEii/AbiGii toxin family protein n=1 Tax=Streptomyces sp. NPDC048241 TaxID=3365521 RepID=UPI003714CC6E
MTTSATSPASSRTTATKGVTAPQYFKVFLGTALVDTIKVDLVVGRTLSDVPEVRLYPVIDHIADKICAMYERHGQKGEFGSNRYRDLADVLLISQQEAVPARVTQALHREAERRRMNGTQVIFPAVFEAPGPDWHGGYPKQAALVVGLQGCRTYGEAAKAAALFIDPLLDQTAQGTWNPLSATWS